ncbi:MAG: alpha/beta fold hydrolase [Pigmentiphaga sp.]
MTGRERSTFVVSDGLKIAADVAGPKGGKPVLLLHGGGQTRGSWRDTIDVLAASGYRAYALDARGHGESDWSPIGEYTPESFSRDLRDVVRQIGDETVVIGASLGGIIGLLVAGEGGPLAVSSLVLVDVAVRTNPYGVKRIQSFMQANPGGFASLDEAADAVAAYAVDRPRPKSNDGLLRNLRQIDGRYYWHWDPRFLESWHPSHAAAMDRLEAAARALKIPVLLIHASRSDVMGEEEAAHLRALVPQAEYVRVESAGHMVVGDKNSVFNKEITEFLSQGAIVD